MQELEKAIDAMNTLLSSFSTDHQTDIKKRIILTFGTEIFEQSKSVKALYETDCLAGVGPIVRVGFTNYVDLVNLVELPGYLHYLSYLSFNQQRKYAQLQLESGGGRLESKTMRDLGMDLNELVTDLKDKSAIERRQLSKDYMQGNGDPGDPKVKVDITDRKRFELAGLASSYDSIYRELSGRTHGFIHSILQKTPDSGSTGWPRRPASVPEGTPMFVARMLAQGGSSIAKKYRKNQDEFQILVDEIKKLEK